MPPVTQNAQVVALLVGIVACVYDVVERRIPNSVTLGAAVAALGYHAWSGGAWGFGWSLGGWALGLALFFPFFALAGMGAGDVKLLAAIGAWLGPAAVLWVALFSGLAGGALALVVSLAHGYVGQAFSNLWSLVGYWLAVGVRSHPDLNLHRGRGPRLAYAVPITAGVAAVLWFR